MRRILSNKVGLAFEGKLLMVVTSFPLLIVTLEDLDGSSFIYMNTP